MSSTTSRTSEESANRLKLISDSLLDICLNFPVGVTRIGHPNQGQASSIQNLRFELKQWIENQNHLTSQLLEISSKRSELTNNNENNNNDEDNLSLLEKQLLNEASRYSNQVRLVEIVQQQPLISDRLNANDKSILKGLLDLRDSKAIEIAKLREETELLHQKIQHQEVLNSNAALRNRNLYKEIEQRLDQGKLESSDQQNDKVKEKNLEKLAAEEKRKMIIRNVFQHLIFESNINWAEDPELREFLGLR